MPDDTMVLDLLKRFAASMATTIESNDIFDELAEIAVAVLGASGAGVSEMTDDGRLLFVTASSEAVVAIERAEEDHQAGPCIDAFRTGEVVAVPKIGDLDRWPEYRAVAERVGFRSAAGIPLAIGDRRVGSLEVYDTRERTWTDLDLAAARVLAAIAATSVVRTGELAAARKLGEQLQGALESRIVIEQAKGMLARDHDIGVDHAYEMLRALSRERSTPLRTIADAVVTLGLRLPR